jgi:hypothetical protein
VASVKAGEKNFDPLISGILFRLFDGLKNEVAVEIIKTIKKSFVNKNQFERARTLLAKGVKFEY